MASNRSRNYRRKFTLVQYVQDEIYHIVKSSEIRRSKNKSIIKAKYLDGIYYDAEVVAKHSCKQLLTEIVKNLVENVPIVILSRVKNSLSRVVEEHDDCQSEYLLSVENNNFVIGNEMQGQIIIDEAGGTVLASHEDASMNNATSVEVGLNENLVYEAVQHEIIILDDILLSPPSVTQFQKEKAGQLLNSDIGCKKSSQQRHCCLYCHKMVFKIYRHYTTVHKKEEAVKEIIALPEKTVHRRVLLDKLRKKGDYMYNTQLKAEQDKLLVCKQTLNNNKTKRVTDVPCPSCKGFYSKFSIRHHLERCMPIPRNNKRRGGIQVECRRLLNNIHPSASEVLKNNVFPVLKDDEITNAIRYDEAVIIYANYLCRKYTTPHHTAQIRSNMRAFGRLILAIKKLNPAITCLYDVLDVRYTDLIVKGIDHVAGLVDNSNLYKAPATAMLLATELKKLCNLLLMEFIKKNDKESQKRMENLSSILSLEFHVTINKKGIETQKINNRRKKTILPKTDDIAKFRIYLENKMKYFINELEKQFSKKNWIQLAEYTLVHLTVFNRKRPGETQRILIDDYTNYEVVDDVLSDYDMISKEQIKKWARIRFTGKLGNNTALLVHREFGFKALDLILKYREQAGVNASNRYVFGQPSTFHTQSTFQACPLIRKFATESGVENSHLLRTRFLRQHLATETATSNVDDRLEGRVSDFMSHKRKIHQDYYVMTQKNDDIIKVSKLLENFSATNEKHSKPCSSKSVECTDFDIEYYSDSDISSNENEKILSKAEVNYVLGRRRPRRSWTSLEKSTAEEYFRDEIYNGKPLQKFKVKQFYDMHMDLYKYRTSHLIMQWIKGFKEKVELSNSGIQAKRARWSTPEKDVLRSSTERHSVEGTVPSIPECELLMEENRDILQRRSAQAIKSFIYSEIKRLARTS